MDETYCKLVVNIYTYIQVVADNLPDDQIHSIKQIFHKMDADKNGNLNFQELKEGLTMLGQQIPDPDVQLLLDAVSIYIHTCMCVWQNDLVKSLVTNKSPYIQKN